jgi:hypothetical protein
VRRVLPLLTLVVSAASCAPAISPLYRDYAYEPADEPLTAAEHEALREALSEAGWTVVPSPAQNVLATEPRTFRRWGIYRTEVELEVAPVAGPYVRVLIHPYRKFFTGGRSKIPYLRRGLAREVLEPLTDALDAAGLVYVGTAQQRDRADGAR